MKNQLLKCFIFLLFICTNFLSMKAESPNDGLCTPPPPPLNTSPSANLSICSGKSTILSASGTGVISWYTSPTGGTYLSSGSNYTTPILTTSTTYYVQDSTCDMSATRTAVTVTVNSLPNISVSSSASSICNGSGVTLASNNASTYVWTPGGFTGSSITITPAGSTIYTVVGTDALGCTNSATKLIIVNPLPNVGTSATASTICNGGSTTVNGTGATFYSWQPGSLSGSILTLSPAVTTTYTVTGVDFGTLCFNTATRTITVNPLPPVAVSASATSICQGSSTTLNSTGAITYVCNPGALSGSSITVAPSVTTTYTVTGTNTATGCTAKSTVTITVNSKPNIVATTTPSAICIGASALLGVTGGSTYLWQPGAISGNSLVVSPTATTTYTVTGTGANGCTNVSSVTVNVNLLPTVGTTTTTNTICLGSSSTLTGTGANIYTWQPGSLSGTSINVSPATATTYTVTGTNNSTGCSNTAIRTIDVNSLPSVTSSATLPTICLGSSTTLNALGADSYVWNPGGLSGSSINVSPLISTTYTVVGTNTSTGCTATSTSNISINSLPNVVTSVSSPSICEGNSATITGNGANTYTWNPGGLNTTSITVSPLTTTIYTITGTNSSTGCTKTNTRTITVNPLPPVTVSATSTTLCAGSSSTLTATGANSYLWAPNGASGNSIIVTPLSSTTYSVTGTSASGCLKTSTISIIVNGLSNVNTTATLTSVCPGSPTSLSATGSSTYVWQPGALVGSLVSVSPLVTTTYTVTGTNLSGCTKTSTRTITVISCGSTLNIKLFIEGYYNGSGFMKPVMMNQGIVSASSSMTDSITVELRNTTFPFALASSIKTILNTNGTAICSFPISGTYYVSVKHRNAIQTWSANPISLSSTAITYDFSTANTKAYGNNMTEVESGIWAFYSGDFNADDNIDLVDLSMMDADISNFLFGYQASDLDGDGNVDILDSPTLETNINNFIFSAHP